MSGLYEHNLLKVTRGASTVPGRGGDAANQDCLGNQQNHNGHLLIVADGHDAGGQGGRASRLVVETILEYFRNWNGQAPRKMLVDGIGMANAALRQAAAADPRLTGVVVSVALLHHQEGTVRIAHVGNCRAYRQRNYVIDQLTADHVTLAQNGAEARQQYVLERAVGLYPIVEVDVSDAHFVQAGETFLLGTDGLNAALTDVEIGRIAMSGEPGPACENLAKMAGAKSGVESVTVAIIKFSEAPGQKEKLSAAVTPSPTLFLAANRSLWPPLSWSQLSGWWKLRLVALGSLVVWFLVLLITWGVMGWGSL